MDPRDAITKDVTVQTLKKMTGYRIGQLIGSGAKKRLIEAIVRGGQYPKLSGKMTSNQVNRMLAGSMKRRGQGFQLQAEKGMRSNWGGNPEKFVQDLKGKKKQAAIDFLRQQ